MTYATHVDDGDWTGQDGGEGGGNGEHSPAGLHQDLVQSLQHPTRSSINLLLLIHCCGPLLPLAPQRCWRSLEWTQ